MRNSIRLLGCCLFALLLAAQAALAQNGELPRPAGPAGTGPSKEMPSTPDEFGLADRTVSIIQSSGFLPYDSTTTYSYANSGYRSITAGSAFMDAPVSLPAGSLIQSIEVEACDDSATAQIRLLFFECGNSPSSICNTAAEAATGVAATPGCNYFAINLVPPIQTDNFFGNYFLRVNDNDNMEATRFRSARIYYRRQVSPAPGVATFPGDVPTTHPYFRFVEALADAGITGGCGAGIYCPDQPVTRGQMAVFLAAALGLHFPN